MGANDLKMLKLLLLIGLIQMGAAQDMTVSDMTVSVFSVTSKSITAQWSRVAGASSYKVTATPVPPNSAGLSVYAQFSATTVMGSVTPVSPNTMYSVMVEAMDSSLVNVISSATTTYITAPDIPTITQVYSKNSNSITVQFTEVTGADSYVLRAEFESGDFFSETVVTGSPGTALNLSPYTEYTLSVMSVNSGGRSQPSYTVNGTTVVTAPVLNTTSPSNNTIIVSWSPVQYAILYSFTVIMMGTDQRTYYNTTATTLTLNDLEPGMNYSIKGTAWDASGRPGDDLTVYQITRPPSPDAIEVLLAPGRGVGIIVYWDGVQGATEYEALSSSGQSCNATVQYYCIMSPIDCGEQHTVFVTAVNEAGPSSPSAPATYLTFPCPPEKIWMEERGPGHLMVMWSNVSMVEYYMAFIKRDDGLESLCNTTNTSCQFDSMCGYTYLITAFAYNEAGPSPQGEVLNYTTIPCCPDDVAVSLVSTETLEITWSRVKGAELYETTAVQTDSVIHCNDTDPLCALSDLQCDSLYSVVVTPCCEIRGCNTTCKPHSQKTAPCSPQIVNLTQTSLTAVQVFFTAPNSPNTTYTVTAAGQLDTQHCVSQSTSCQLTQLPCGTTYEVTAVASAAVGDSLPSFSVPLETAPCCPTSLSVVQVNQALTNVSWSAAYGARSYATSLTSPRGHAKCNTMGTHCLMGCITCGTNYNVSLEAISSTGHMSQCNFLGFSSSACCPTGVRLYQLANNTLRVYWRPSGLPQTQNYVVDLYGTSNYSCVAAPMSSFCDVTGVMCGNDYTIVVAPVTANGSKVSFCPNRQYSVTCSGSNLGMVIYRGKRSLD